MKDECYEKDKEIEKCEIVIVKAEALTSLLLKEERKYEKEWGCMK